MSYESVGLVNGYDSSSGWKRPRVHIPEPTFCYFSYFDSILSNEDTLHYTSNWVFNPIQFISPFGSHVTSFQNTPTISASTTITDIASDSFYTSTIAIQYLQSILPQIKHHLILLNQAAETVKHMYNIHALLRNISHIIGIKYTNTRKMILI